MAYIPQRNPQKTNPLDATSRPAYLTPHLRANTLRPGKPPSPYRQSLGRIGPLDRVTGAFLFLFPGLAHNARLDPPTDNPETYAMP